MHVLLLNAMASAASAATPRPNIVRALAASSLLFTPPHPTPPTGVCRGLTRALARPLGGAPSPRSPRARIRRQVFILTDDQSLAMDPAGIPLGDMEPMVQTRKLLIEGGLHMANWFVNTPVCCPSRSEYLSGRYAHNIRDNHFENSFDCDDYNLSAPITCGCMRMNSTIDSFENAHYGNLLQQHGYLTAYFGKYLNPPAMEP